MEPEEISIKNVWVNLCDLSLVLFLTPLRYIQFVKQQPVYKKIFTGAFFTILHYSDGAKVAFYRSAIQSPLKQCW